MLCLFSDEPMFVRYYIEYNHESNAVATRIHFRETHVTAVGHRWQEKH
jgi:hypothetical protein